MVRGGDRPRFPGVAQQAEGVTVAFRAPSAATLTTGNALTKAAILVLLKQWPLGLPFAQLVATARSLLREGATTITGAEAVADDALRLGNDMLQRFAANVIELRAWFP